MTCSQLRKSAAALAALAALLAPISSLAVPMSYSNSTPQSIVDNSSITSDIVIGDPGVVGGLTVSVAIDHTWVGDLIIRLTGPDATVITLMNRPGVPPSAVGENSNLSVTFPLLFVDGAALAAEHLGDSPCTSTNDVIGVDCPSTAAPDDPLSTFLGDPIAGTWTLFVSDNANLDQGRLASWTLNFDVANSPAALPEPGSLALAGVALLGLLATARRRRKI